MPPTDDAAGSVDGGLTAGSVDGGLTAGHPFLTVFGRGLVGELPNIAHPPYLVVTMADLWPMFEPMLAGRDLAGVHLVESIEVDRLESLLDSGLDAVPAASSVIGLGGGQALDVAKYVSWRRRLPLFQVPTALTVNAPWGHRAGLRTAAGVRYLGWAVPEAVYVDIDVIQAAPPALNRSGVGDVLCYHTAHHDWRLAHELGKVEGRWPYDERLVAAARLRLDAVLARLDDIRDVTEEGIRTLALAHRWGGSTFHDAGWNPRHIEGVDHFFFYNLERITGRHFIHGQPVGLGIYVGSLWQENHADDMLAALHRAGVDIRPEAMGVTWDDVAEAVRTLPAYVRDAGLWFTVVDAVPVDGSLVDRARSGIEAVYGAWEGG
jgi:glycerol-1-phosphate dehydrogenase [NAD(P)+]